MRFWRLVYEFLFLVKRAPVLAVKDEYRQQLDALKNFIAEDLNKGVTYSHESNTMVVLCANAEIIARVTFHTKGILRRNTFVCVRTSDVSLTAWFQLAFLGMKVSVVPLKEILLLTHHVPREP